MLSRFSAVCTFAVVSFVGQAVIADSSVNYDKCLKQYRSISKNADPTVHPACSLVTQFPGCKTAFVDKEKGYKNSVSDSFQKHCNEVSTAAASPSPLAK